MPNSLGAIDILVLAVSLVAVIVIGLRGGGKSTTLEAYLLGDRNLPWWAILGSIVSTETSTATVLSVPGRGYGPPGMTFLQLAIGYIIGRAIVVRMLLPLYFRRSLITAYEVLDQRFGLRMKQAASLLFLVTRNLGDGLRLFLVAMVLQELAGWPFAGSILTVGLVTMVYTYVGGMRSVVWNDCLQFVIYLIGGIAAVFVIAANIPGGWSELWEYARVHDKFRVIDWRLTWDNPYNIWAGVIGGAMLTLGSHGTDHMMVQRYLSARSERDAGRAVFLSSLVVFLQFALFLFIGIELACYYSHHPELTFEKTDKVFSHFIVHYFPKNTGLVGLMLAAILAAAMSTSLNSTASSLVHDFYLPLRREPVSPDRALVLTRRMVLFFGFVQIGIGFWAIQFTNAVVDNALMIASFSAGLMLGVYSLGVLTRSVGSTAALCGAAVGLTALLIVQYGVPMWGAAMTPPEVWKPIAFPWLAPIGATTTFVAGSLAALIFPRRELTT
ncbi:MAG: sodium:solute symporter [Planctomycetaceae bacterium]|nr:sodium:solute symporter [Planctomycetaceae bacterium]